MMMASNSPHLPEIPRSNLPSWPRGHIKPSLQPIPLSKDKFQSVKNTHRSSCSSSSSTSGAPSRCSGPLPPERKHSVKLPPVPGARGAESRASQLEKDMTFLKSQHRDTLIKLHEEVERLKKRNKDLTFQLAMGGSREERSCITTRSPKWSTDESVKALDRSRTPDELRSILLEEEVRDLRNALANEKSKTSRLMRVIEQRRPRSIDQSDADSVVSAHSPMGQEKEMSPGGGGRQGAPPLPHQGGPHQPPTVAQYESIIKHLQKANDTMAHELIRLKADLRDVLFTEKLTPESFLIAKAYVKRDGDEDLPPGNALPIFSVRQDAPHNMLNEAYRTMNESVSLPRLKPKLPSNIAERKRKTKALQKARMGQTLPKL